MDNRPFKNEKEALDWAIEALSEVEERLGVFLIDNTEEVFEECPLVDEIRGQVSDTIASACGFINAIETSEY
jgi:hypothetical protein